MSQFEFVSVGVALVYSFAAARLLAALPSVLEPGRRYWTHVIWVAVAMLALAGSWWQVWLYRSVEWNALLFIWLLSLPGLIYVRVGVLVSPAPESVRSWREHFFCARVPFFAVGLAIAANSVLFPWASGLATWSALAPWSVFIALLYACGLATERPRVHAGLAILNLIGLTGALIVTTWIGGGAA